MILTLVALAIYIPLITLIGMPLATAIFVGVSIWYLDRGVPRAILIGRGVGLSVAVIVQLGVTKQVYFATKVPVEYMSVLHGSAPEAPEFTNYVGWQIGVPILILGTFCSLMYFFFSIPHPNPGVPALALALASLIALGRAVVGWRPGQLALSAALALAVPFFKVLAAVADMLARAGNAPGDLKCGTHAPGFYERRGEVPPPPPYSPLAHNCSGKHSGMLACCVHCGFPKDSYLAFEHPLQRAIRRAVAHFTSTPEADLVGAIDGCSAHNYAVPLERLALAYARLAAGEDDADTGGRPGHWRPP